MDLDRKYLMDVHACGAVSIRQRGNPIAKGALPFFSTDTFGEALELRTRLCRKERESDLYRLNDKPSDIEDLEHISMRFASEYQHIQRCIHPHNRRSD